MISTRRFFILLAMMLTLPFLATHSLAAQNQGPGGPGGPQGRGRGGPGRGPMSVDDRVKMLTKALDLTSDQQTKLKPILEDQQTKMQELVKSGDTDRNDMRTKMMAIQKNGNDQIRALLDDTQKEKFDKMEQRQQQRGRGQRGGQGGPGGSGNADGQNPPAQN